MALLLDQSSAYASAAELAAVQREIEVVAGSLPVQFMGTEDGVLAIKIEDGVNRHDPADIRAMMNAVVNALMKSTDPVVKGVVERSVRIGIV